MKEFLKRLVVLTLCAGMAFGLAACADGDSGDSAQPDNADQTAPVTPPSGEEQGGEQEKPELPVTPPEEDVNQYWVTRFSTTDLNAVYKKIRDGKNYTLNVDSETDLGGSLERDGDRMYYTDRHSGANYFATNDGVNDLKIYYDTTNNKWIGTIVKSSDELTVADANNRIPLILNSISYKRYNTKTGEFKGTWNDFDGVTQDVSVFVNKEDETVTSLEMQVHDERYPYTFNFLDFGTTSVTLPTYTLNGAEIDNSKNVLTVTNGKYNFDYKLIRPIFENWLKGENSYGVDLVDRAAAQRTLETEQVLFMNLSKDKLEAYIAYKDLNENRRYLTKFNINDSELLAKFQSGKNMTENELANHLKTTIVGVTSPLGSKSYSVDYITSDSDFASHQGQFNTLTDKIIERAQTVGVQGSNIENAGTPVDYSDYNIVCGFKTLPELSSFTYVQVVGEHYDFYMGYLVEKDGKYYLLDFRVASKTQYGFNNLYTNITEQDATTSKNWFILSSTLIDMSEGNGALFN